MLYTHRGVRCRNADGQTIRRNVRVSIEGNRDDPAVRKAIADALASSNLSPAESPPVEPESPQFSRADIHAMNKAELIDWINANPELSGIDTNGTVKVIETAVFTRMGI